MIRLLMGNRWSLQNVIINLDYDFLAGCVVSRLGICLRGLRDDHLQQCQPSGRKDHMQSSDPSVATRLALHTLDLSAPCKPTRPTTSVAVDR